MCGIAGIVAPAAENYHPHLTRMTRALTHRGPDANGEIFFPQCALGHTRLSIVDLAGSPQPMAAPDLRGAVTFNGEIYGYRRLRDSLDYSFRTVGDTELLLALHQRHGADMPQYLPGMFAFALWDDRTNTLLCARDRFGEKPLFYATGRSGELIFASEIKALIASGLVVPEICPASLGHYLRRGYVHPARTIYRNVHTLPPAHRLVWHDGRISIDRYWSLPAPSGDITIDAAAEKFRELFERAVARQLIADVPVGAFLSGGLDSSTIVAVASKHAARCRTFSFGFGNSINELPYAREIAQRYGTEHMELTDDTSDIAELLPRMQEVYDEPFGDSSNIPVWLLSRQARQHITVALAGEGGDELTGGYDFWYRPAFNLERALRLPRIVNTLLRAAAAAAKICRKPMPRTLAELWEGFFLRDHHTSALDLHTTRTAFFSDAQLTSLGFPANVPSPSGDLDAVLRADLTDYLAGDVLVKTDRASMAHGLEIRCPFLDVDFASFCISLPARLKLDAQTDKLILRAAFAEAWTPSIRTRRKQGFGAPVGDWLRRPFMRDLADATLGNPRARLYDFVPREATREFLDAGNQQTWLLLVLALWLEKHHA